MSTIDSIIESHLSELCRQYVGVIRRKTSLDEINGNINSFVRAQLKKPDVFPKYRNFNESQLNIKLIETRVSTNIFRARMEVYYGTRRVAITWEDTNYQSDMDSRFEYMYKFIVFAISSVAGYL